jgi:hypothetical protein
VDVLVLIDPPCATPLPAFVFSGGAGRPISDGAAAAVGRCQKAPGPRLFIAAITIEGGKTMATKSRNSGSADPQQQPPDAGTDPNSQQNEKPNLRKEIISDVERDAADAIEKRIKQ